MTKPCLTCRYFRIHPTFPEKDAIVWATCDHDRAMFVDAVTGRGEQRLCSTMRVLQLCGADGKLHEPRAKVEAAPTPFLGITPERMKEAEERMIGMLRTTRGCYL